MVAENNIKGMDQVKKGEGKWRAFLNEMLTRPGEWGHTTFKVNAKISAKQYASNIRKNAAHGREPLVWADGQQLQFEEGHWEAAYEEKPKGSREWVVWARFIPSATFKVHTTPPEEVARVIRKRAGVVPVQRKAGRPGRRKR